MSAVDLDAPVKVGTNGEIDLCSAGSTFVDACADLLGAAMSTHGVTTRGLACG
ncbi:hypothetical protein [Streptomyces rhizosphaerihabitans]|uniref:hypothetical protein n=1 Tax=Streptomyces rhizosphaerihabitans TaxID=1266770 RepID=UPI0021C2405E|nr:hypothetical protein [Streptomyces rhizosphaerihabitans]MCT9006902.1 hypothetical protein [Streptomyces rhizosphaerihabitans]